MIKHMPFSAHGRHAQDCVSLDKTEYEKVAKYFAAEGYWSLYAEERLIGFINEIPLEEDESHFQYLILREYYDRFRKKTA